MSATAETGLEHELRMRGAQMRAVGRKVDEAPAAVSATAPNPGGGSDGVAIMVQSTNVIRIRDLVRAVNPATKLPIISDEQLGQISEQIELEMSRRGLRR